MGLLAIRGGALWAGGSRPAHRAAGLDRRFSSGPFGLNPAHRAAGLDRRFGSGAFGLIPADRAAGLGRRLSSGRFCLNPAHRAAGLDRRLGSGAFGLILQRACRNISLIAPCAALQSQFPAARLPAAR